VSSRGGIPLHGIEAALSVVMLEAISLSDLSSVTGGGLVTGSCITEMRKPIRSAAHRPIRPGKPPAPGSWDHIPVVENPGWNRYE
jgi:hypothetical protein